MSRLEGIDVTKLKGNVWMHAGEIQVLEHHINGLLADIEVVKTVDPFPYVLIKAAQEMIHNLNKRADKEFEYMQEYLEKADD